MVEFIVGFIAGAALFMLFIAWILRSVGPKF